MTSTMKEALAQLELAGNDKVRAHNRKNGAEAAQFGVPLGEIRKLAAKIKADHELAVLLWETENIDARLLAILLFKPKNLSLGDMNRMVGSINFVQVADWFNAYLAKKHPEKDSLRERWMAARSPWVARAGWSLTSERVAKNAEGLDLPALLDRLEAQMGSAPPEAQWTMNSCLASIGIHFPKHRKRAIAIGEKLGLYRDYPVSKGCTSPFAPIWINEMVSRPVPFDGRETNHLSRQPFGQVPFLSDGELEISESGAGLLHLARKNEKLMPRDPVGEAETVQWMIAALNSIEMVTVPWWFLEVSGVEDNHLADWMGNRLDQLEKVLNEREWLAADRFTAADLLMADVLRIPKVRSFGDRPATDTYVTRVTDRPSFKKARADQLAHFAAADESRSAAG